MSNPTNKNLRAGQMLFSEGEQPRSLYLIRKGTMAIRKMKGSGFVDIARVGTNEVIGELSFFDHQSRSAAAFAVTDVELTEIPFETLEKIFASVPPYFRSIVISLADRLRKADETIKRIQKTSIGHVEESEAPQKEAELDASTALAAAAAALDTPSDPQKN